MSRYRVVHLDDVEALPGPGSLTWRPVRLTLGIEAFGTNAYTAAKAGDDVVEPHSESPVYNHQELYFVARGRARFILDGEEIDAPAGTYVFIPDISVHRHAIAEEPGTTVLSFGGPPTFTPSAWEWSFQASAARADPERARSIIDDGLQHYPESPSLFYELACLEEAQGHRDEAVAALRRAIELEPELAKVWPDDEDLSDLDPEQVNS